MIDSASVPVHVPVELGGRGDLALGPLARRRRLGVPRECLFARPPRILLDPSVLDKDKIATITSLVRLLQYIILLIICNNVYIP